MDYCVFSKMPPEYTFPVHTTIRPGLIIRMLEIAAWPSNLAEMKYAKAQDRAAAEEKLVKAAGNRAHNTRCELTHKLSCLCRQASQ